MSKSAEDADPDQRQDPFLDADLNKWAARSYWTPAEIAALSLGKHPWSLDCETAKEHRETWYAWEFLERLDVFHRAAEIDIIPWRCPPNRAMEYIEKLGLPCVPKLGEQVERFHPLLDWEGAFFRLAKASENSNLRLEAELASYRAALEAAEKDTGELAAWRNQAIDFIQKLQMENREVSSQLEELQATPKDDQTPRPIAANDNADDDLPPKERHSKDMMIAAMAITGYGFDPASKKSNMPGELAGDIAELGYKLTPEVISRHIRQACRRLGISKRPNGSD